MGWVVNAEVKERVEMCVLALWAFVVCSGVNIMFIPRWLSRKATPYGLEGPGIESPWGRDFSHPPDGPKGSPSLLYNGYRVFPGGKTDVV
jgi:hypothetical protein